MFDDLLETLSQETIRTYDSTPFYAIFSWKLSRPRGGGQRVKDLYALLQKHMERERGWTVQNNFDRGIKDCGGWCMPRPRLIYVRPSYPNNMFMNLVHESAHALDADTVGANLMLSSLYASEQRAEGVAFLVAQHFGVGVGDNILLRSSDYLSFQSMQHWKNPREYPVTLWAPDIKDMARQLIEGIEG